MNDPGSSSKIVIEQLLGENRRSILWIRFLAGALLVIGVSVLLLPVEACASSCGLKPLAPIGCHDAVCYCNAEGYCQWIWECSM